MVLALAAEQDRILVSHDFQTMPQHFGEFLGAQCSSPGVFLVKQSSPVGEVIDETCAHLVGLGRGRLEESEFRDSPLGHSIPQKTFERGKSDRCAVRRACLSGFIG